MKQNFAAATLIYFGLGLHTFRMIEQSHAEMIPKLHNGRQRTLHCALLASNVRFELIFAAI